MRLRDRFSLVLIILACLMASADSAWAQAWLQDRDSKEGTGVRVGDLELHPGIAAMMGYNSNPFYRDDLDIANDPIDGAQTIGVNSSGVFQLTPHLDVSTISRRRREDGDEVVTPPFLDFRAGLSASWYFMTYAGQADQLEINGNLLETFNPERPFTLHLTQEVSRRRIPLAGTSNVQTHLAGGIRPEFSTPGGLLKGSLRYKFGYDFFDDSTNNNLLHSIGQQLSWEFLPKTALFQDLALDIQNFTTSADISSLRADKNDSYRVTGRAGLNGALTKTVSVTLAAGLTDAFVTGANDAKDVVAQADLHWRPTSASSISLYGRRTGENALQGNTLTRTGAGIKASLVVAGALSLGGEAKLETMEYGDDTRQLLKKTTSTLDLDPRQTSLNAQAFSLDPRSDLRVNVDLNAEYRFTSWLAVTAEFGYFLNSSDYVFLSEFAPAGGPSLLIANPAAFEGYRVFGGVRAFL